VRRAARLKGLVDVELADRPKLEHGRSLPVCKDRKRGSRPATLASMAIRRIMPYHESPDFEATRAFYTRVLGLEEGDFGGGYIGFGSGQAQVLFAPPGVEPALPDMGVDVGSWAAVDAAHAEAVEAGHEVIYGPVDEPWGVRRFFVRDPNGVVISVLAHD
jgi:predicted enzyme related to lactoylglutathione lyase